MLKLQDVKMGLAEAALGEGTGTRLHKMSVKEIKFVSFPKSILMRMDGVAMVDEY